MDNANVSLETTSHTLEEYRALCKKEYCKWCGASLPLEVKHYPHPGGWRVTGMEERQWLYLHCVRCKYDHALWKLGAGGRGSD